MNNFLTIKDLVSLLTKKEVSPTEILSHYHSRLQKYNAKLNCAVEIFDIPAPTTNTGLLANIPYLAKDNISQQGKITSAGSNILREYKAPYNATVINRLSAQGALSLGRANMDEFAMGGSGEFSAYGAAKNPWDITKTPGGSSSGSAAAVAAGLVPFALGSETGGSVRQPASFCSLVGLYPTYGSYSRFGILPFASSTDQVGPLTKTVYDNALVSSALSGHDSLDSTSLQQASIDYTKNLTGELPKGLKVGVLQEALDSKGMNPEVKAAFERAIETLRQLGATIMPISMPSLDHGIATYFIISRAEAASNLSRFDGSLYGSRVAGKTLEEMYNNTRQAGFGQEVKRRILTGNYVLAAGHKDAFYKKALAVRALMREEFQKTFQAVDLVISPTVPTLPFTLGSMTQDPLAMYLADYFTVPNCIVGTPGLSLPCGFSQNNEPIGFQFMGPAHSEALIYQAAYAYEQNTNYHTKVPNSYE